jgi:carbon storage regulator CsrA
MFVFTRGVDEWIVIGDDILVAPTDIDEKSVRLIAKGRMLGGPSDGGTFQSVHELSKGQSFPIGPMIQITLVEVRGEVVRLGVQCPPHLALHRKESPKSIQEDKE